ncbi:MAG: hypothetical protein VE97_C0004G0008, partial [candidate division Kazan bacterium GW2011_GWB1_45_10]
MLKQIQKTILTVLKEELITLLALLMVATGLLFAKAEADISAYITVYPIGGSITVTDPNGGETWTVNTGVTIAWTTLGPINDVKIELQRATGGTWEELTSSTTNDGSYSWSVTTPATNQALIKISKVGDDTVTDTSNAAFTIKSAITGGRGRTNGGDEEEPPYTPPEQPAPPKEETPVKKPIDLKSTLTIVDYSPKIIIHDRPNKLFVYAKVKEDLLKTIAAGLKSQSTIHVTKEDLLEDLLKDVAVELAAPSTTYIAPLARVVSAPDDPNLIILEYFIPAFAPPKGLIDLTIVVQPDKTILADKLKIYVIDALPPQELKVKVPVLDTRTIELLSQAESKIKLKFTNTGNLDWDSLLQPIHIGTSRPRDRKSKFIDPSWPYSNRAARIVLPGIIKPGESFDAEFTVQAPTVKRSTKFTEYFALVADGLAWVEDSEFKVNILVKPLSQSKSTVVVKPTPEPTNVEKIAPAP